MKTKTVLLTKSVLLISMVSLAPVAIAQEKTTGITTTPGKTAVLPGSLTTVIADSTSFSTLSKALRASGLEEVLGGEEAFTVFAPTDEAFGKLPEATLTKLMLPENKEKLRMLLLYHVIAGTIRSSELTNGAVKTVNGEKVTIAVSSEKIEIEGTKIYSSDVKATNGIMHSIGMVLIPESLKGFAGLKN